MAKTNGTAALKRFILKISAEGEALHKRCLDLQRQLLVERKEVVRLRQDLAVKQQLVDASDPECNFWQMEAHRLARVVAAAEPARDGKAFAKLDVNHPPFA